MPRNSVAKTSGGREFVVTFPTGGRREIPYNLEKCNSVRYKVTLRKYCEPSVSVICVLFLSFICVFLTLYVAHLILKYNILRSDQLILVSRISRVIATGLFKKKSSGVSYHAFSPRENPHSIYLSKQKICRYKKP